MPAAAALFITPDDLAELHRWARSAQLPAVLVQRARILLLAADGAANTEIAQRVGVSRPTMIATTIYVAVALGVYGTLTVDKVISSGGTALAVAAEPVLGRAGYWLMSVTALFSTAGATNAGLYPAAGLCEEMAAMGQFPPVLGRRFGGRAPAGLLITAATAIVLAVGFLMVRRSSMAR